MSTNFDRATIERGGTYVSCDSLNFRLVLGVDGLYQCCDSNLRNADGSIVQPCIRKLGDDLICDDTLVNDLINSKKELIYKLNAGIDCECTGCERLYTRNWDPIDEKFGLGYLSFQSDQICNCNCIYCFQDHSANIEYDIVKVIEFLMQKNIVRYERLHAIFWGGGEPSISEPILYLFKKLEFSEQSKHKTYIASSAIKFSEEIAKRLNSKPPVRLIISIDSGNAETYKRVKRVDQFNNVLTNIKHYHDVAEDKSRVQIKYIMLEENCEESDLNDFVQMVSDNKLADCNFQVVHDMYQNEINYKVKSGEYYLKLKMLEKLGKLPLLHIAAGPTILEKYSDARVAELENELAKKQAIINELSKK